MNQLSLTLLVTFTGSLCCPPAVWADETVLRGNDAQVTIAAAGGGIVDFHFLDHGLNPLTWEIPDQFEGTTAADQTLRGHFICLDRWGAPSEAEKKNGVPFHGEAPRANWHVTDISARSLSMACQLPIAGLAVKRSVRLENTGAVLHVTEEVTNTNKIGRIYNFVQHPTISPPFVDETVVVDTNAQQGFDQAGVIPTTTTAASVWPEIVIGGRAVNLRHFKSMSGNANTSDVSSFVFDDKTKYGWVTASNASAGLLIGYLWKTAEYPWLNMWRYRHKGRGHSRGLEFGTTGYHKPYPVLVKTGQLLGRPLYEFLDAGETTKKSYTCFLLKIPTDYKGVATASFGNGLLTLTERREDNPREFRVEIE